MGRYLAKMHLRCNDRDILIVKGAWQDHQSASTWHGVENEPVPPSTTIRAGSIIEYDLPQDRLDAAFARGVLAEADAEYHFDLDRVFDMKVKGALNAGKLINASDALKEWGLFTLEDIVDGKPATRPVTGETVPIRELLLRWGSEAQVAMWLRAAQNIVSQGKAEKQAAEQPPNIVVS